MRERHQVTLSRTAQGRGLHPERWAQTGPRSARVASTVQARSGPGRVPRSPRTHRPSSTSQVSPLPCIYVGLILKSIGFELESDTGKLKKNCAVHRSRFSREQRNQGELKHTENSLFLARRSGFRQEKVRGAWEKGLQRTAAGSYSRSPRGTGLAPQSGNAEGCSPTGGGLPPPSTSGRRKEGEPPSANTVLSILPSPRGPRPVPKAMGRGAELMRGRKEAALLGELMGVSGEH